MNMKPQKLILIPIVLACFGLLPQMQAADGDLGGGNTNEGFNALNNLSTGGVNNGEGGVLQLALAEGVFYNAGGAGSPGPQKRESQNPAGPGATVLHLTSNKKT